MPRVIHPGLRKRIPSNGIALLVLFGIFLNPAVAAERADIGLRTEERDPNHWILRMGAALIEENYRGVFTIAEAESSTL